VILFELFFFVSNYSFYFTIKINYMESRAKAHLDEAIDRVRLSFSNVFSEGIDIWKKGLGPLLGFMLIYLVINGVVGLIPMAGDIINTFLLTPALTVGAFVYCHNLLRGREEFGDFFKGFQILPKIIVVNLITYIVYIVLLLPFIFSTGTENLMGMVSGDLEVTTYYFQEFDWTLMVMLIPACIAVFLFAFSLAMIWFYKLSPLDAIKYSCKLVLNNFLTIIALFLVSLLFAISGIIGLFIGIFVTIPIMYTMSYAIFAQGTDLFGYLDGKQELDISEHLIGGA